jgi:hypothetical protein
MASVVFPLLYLRYFPVDSYLQHKPAAGVFHPIPKPPGLLGDMTISLDKLEKCGRKWS